MKKNHLILAVLAISFASCTKAPVFEEEAQGLKGEVYEAELTANLPVGTKLSLDGLNLNWTSGEDQLKVRCGNLQDWTTDPTDFDVLTASSDGASVKFTGTIRYTKTAENKMNRLYVFCSKYGNYPNKSAGTYQKTLPSEQSGRLEDFLDNAFLYSLVDTLNITDSGNTCQMSTTMKPFFSVIKMNVASSLGVKSIKLCAPSVAGAFKVNITKTYGTIGSSDFLTLVTPEDYVNVSRSGETISGDVYILVTPDSYDTAAKEYCLDAQSLRFVFTNEAGDEAEVVGTLNSKIMCGALKNLGNVTSLDFRKPPIDGGYLTLLEDNVLKVSVADTVSGCKFYYEQGDGYCPEPTIASTQFFAKDGFTPGDGSNYFARYIKVLVHTEDPSCSDLVLKGFIRNWGLNSGAGIYGAYQDYLSQTGKTSLTKADDGMISADGLTIYMHNDNGATLVPANKGGMAVLKNDTGRAFITSTTLYNADCTFRHRTYTADTKDLNRIIRIFANGAEVANDAFDIDVVQTKVHRFADCNAGMLYKFRPSSTFYYSAISILESSKNFVVPTEQSELTPAFKFLCGKNEPTVVLDTAAFGPSVLAKGAKIYYTAGTEGFASLALPTASDDELTAIGIPVAATATRHDSLYVKVLAKCSGFDDVYARIFVRSWTFGTNYEPDLPYVPGSSKTDVYPFPNYFGLTFSKRLSANGSWPNRVQINPEGEISAAAVIGGNCHAYMKIGSCSAGTTLIWRLGGSSAGSSAVEGFYASAGARSFQSEAKEIAAGAVLNVKAVKTAQFTSFGTIEVGTLDAPTKSFSGVGIEGFSGKTPYSL